ncbi:alpha/beta hydrolase-fold protein [Emticicia sp. 17c]|uniref:carboxylesterase family protein n=1 Tax=Emticicia sp. 17c TaxID=3127704 RepID=UPI003FA53AAE
MYLHRYVHQFTIGFYFVLCLTQIQYTHAQANIKPKAKYNYLLYLPKDYDKKTMPYPVIIYLHGSSHRGTDLNKLKGYGLPYLIEQGKEFNFIIASPQCPDGKYWSSENWFDSLYTELTSKYRVDTQRVYLTGISLGGYGTFIAGMDHADKLAAMVPLCGGCNDSDMPRICNTLKTMPIWTFHGTADNVIPISETERIVKTLEGCQGNIKFTKLTDEGHGIQYLYERDDIYEWMLQWKRK